jgi:hypothetical protein
VFCSFLALVLKTTLEDPHCRARSLRLLAGDHRRSGFADRDRNRVRRQTLHRPLGAAPGRQLGLACRRRRAAADRPRRNCLLTLAQSKMSRIPVADQKLNKSRCRRSARRWKIIPRGLPTETIPWRRTTSHGSGPNSASPICDVEDSWCRCGRSAAGPSRTELRETAGFGVFIAISTLAGKNSLEAESPQKQDRSARVQHRSSLQKRRQFPWRRLRWWLRRRLRWWLRRRLRWWLRW